MAHDDSQPSIDWKQWLMKAGGTGAAAAAVFYLLGERGTVQLFGQNLPAVLPLGLGCAAGSLSADVAHQFVFPLIPHDAKYDESMATALSVGASGAGAAVATMLLGFQPNLRTVLAGSGAYVGYDFFYHRFLMPKDGGLY